MNMSNKKEIRLHQKLVAVVKKTFLFSIFIFLSVILSSCNMVMETITDSRINALENEINNYREELDKLNERLDNIYDLFTDISLNVVQANVMVNTKASKTNFGLIGPVIGGQGSGVIFSEDDIYYYILTNNHVIYVPDGYVRIEYEISDYKMNTYNGELLYNSADYDLAVIRIRKQNSLTVLAFAANDPSKNDLVIAIGQPEGQVNAITFGKVLGYDMPNCVSCDPKKSNVQFNCIYHDASINRGNSGGMLINENKEIVGINTFGSDDLSVAMSVPISRVIEFLQLKGFILK